MPTALKFRRPRMLLRNRKLWPQPTHCQGNFMRILCSLHPCNFLGVLQHPPGCGDNSPHSSLFTHYLLSRRLSVGPWGCGRGSLACVFVFIFKFYFELLFYSYEGQVSSCLGNVYCVHVIWSWNHKSCFLVFFPLLRDKISPQVHFRSTCWKLFIIYW